MTPAQMDYGLSTVVGTVVAVASDQAVRMASSKQNIGSRDVISAIGGAILGNAIKYGISYYLKNKTPGEKSQVNKTLRSFLNPANLVVPTVASVATVALFVLVRRS